MVNSRLAQSAGIQRVMERNRANAVKAAAGMDAVQVYSLDMGHGNSPKPHEMMAYYDEVLGQLEIPGVISTHQ